MIRTAYFLAGCGALLVGGIGVIVPLLPTVPFLILAAACFARSNRRLEQWLIEHPAAGPHIMAWRRRGAISRNGKRAAVAAFAVSAAAGLLALQLPWSLVPLAVGLLGSGWILSRPEP